MVESNTYACHCICIANVYKVEEIVLKDEHFSECYDFTIYSGHALQASGPDGITEECKNKSAIL